MVEALAKDHALIVDRVYAAVAVSDDTYRSLSPAHRQDVRSHIAFSVTLWLRTLRDGGYPNAHDNEILTAYGRRRVHLGVPLNALLGAIRIGTQELWRTMVKLAAGDPVLMDELVGTVCPGLLAFFDQMARSIGAAYADERRHDTQWRRTLRNALACVVLSLPDDASGFRRACEGLGVDPTLPRVALALELTHPGMSVSRSDDEAERIVLAVARQMKVSPDDLVSVVHAGRFIVWAPTVRGESMFTTDKHMEKVAHALVRGVPDIRGVGVGLMHEGAPGWSVSVDEALKALQAGRARDSARAVFLYSELAVTDSVLGADNVLRYLNSLLERIAIEPDLLTTLAAYFEQGQHRKLTASALGIHPNTLNYRLLRIEAILGARLADAGWIARLHLVLQLRRSSRP
jgi:hypothetical protein